MTLSSTNHHPYIIKLAQELFIFSWENRHLLFTRTCRHYHLSLSDKHILNHLYLFYLPTSPLSPESFFICFSMLCKFLLLPCSVLVILFCLNKFLWNYNAFNHLLVCLPSLSSILVLSLGHVLDTIPFQSTMLKLKTAIRIWIHASILKANVKLPQESSLGMAKLKEIHSLKYGAGCNNS